MWTHGGCKGSEKLGVDMLVVGTLACYMSHQAVVSTNIKWMG